MRSMGSPWGALGAPGRGAAWGRRCSPSRNLARRTLSASPRWQHRRSREPMRSFSALPAALVACPSRLAWAAPRRRRRHGLRGAPRSRTSSKLDLYGWVQPRFTYQQQDTRPSVNFTPIPAFNVERARLGTIASLGPLGPRAAGGGRLLGPVRLAVRRLRRAASLLSPIHEKVASLNLTAGQFRVPISRQNLLPSVGYQLPDVAYFVAPNFLLDRDIGGKLGTDLFDGQGAPRGRRVRRQQPREGPGHQDRPGLPRRGARRGLALRAGAPLRGRPPPARRPSTASS